MRGDAEMELDHRFGIDQGHEPTLALRNVTRRILNMQDVRLS
jgi:hypothetical protein